MAKEVSISKKLEDALREFVKEIIVEELLKIKSSVSTIVKGELTSTVGGSINSCIEAEEDVHNDVYPSLGDYVGSGKDGDVENTEKIVVDSPVSTEFDFDGKDFDFEIS